MRCGYGHPTTRAGPGGADGEQSAAHLFGGGETHPGVLRALRRRNERVGRFWLASDQPGPGASYPGGDVDPVLDGRRVLVVDAEDSFAVMLGQQLRSLGLDVTVRRHDEPFTVDAYDLVVSGPGRGDPRDGADPRVRLRS
ncbi:hypothetical protein [Micromonospora humidisoli]|uniref:Uncharacterized protein n=1 Tax=Micromonospora humidisoli TaxID=2807622 RepID=A0ABS2JB39_9ACTN|nr:hypothetical protein [Micromonospora humidisoli]MBM7083381.1 hypothetical protein [Micromonospora humidisoli]